MKVTISATLSLLVKPKEEAMPAIKKIMESIINNPNKKFEIFDIKYFDPVEIKDGFYSVYSKFKIRGELEDVFGVIMDYGFANIEVLEPTKLELSATELQSILNDLSGVINDLDSKIKYYSAQAELLKLKYNNSAQ
jgi:hypothetical protein